MMKNKTINKITSVILTVLIAFTAFQLNISAAEAGTSVYIATVTTSDGSTKEYDTLADAVAYAMSNEGSIVTLNESTNLSSQIVMQSFTTANSLTIDLNGFTVSRGSTAFHVGGKTTLTVKDSKGTGSVSGMINLNNTAVLYLVGVKVVGSSTGITISSADAKLIADKNSSISVTNSFGKAVETQGTVIVDGTLIGGGNGNEIFYKGGTIDLSNNTDPEGVRIRTLNDSTFLSMADVKLPEGYYCFDADGNIIESTSTATGIVTVKEMKTADYSAVDKAIATANALNKDDYIDFSAVESAINAVDRSKNITEQDEVDAMAKAINDAIEAAINAKNQMSVEAIGFEIKEFDENRVTIFWEEDIIDLIARIDALIADENIDEAGLAKLLEYKAQAEKLIEIINSPIEYISLRFFYLIWDCLTWKYNGILGLFSKIF